MLIAAGALILAGAMAAVVVELKTGGSAEVLEAAANSVVAINPRTNRVETVIGVGRTPSAVAVGEGAVWVLNADNKTISKIDPQAGRGRRDVSVSEGTRRTSRSGRAPSGS